MTQPPKKELYVTANKLAELHREHKFQQRLLRCQSKSDAVQQDYWLDRQHKKELIRHFDPDTNDEILVEAVYTDNPPGTNVQRIILKLETDDTIYNLRLL